MDKLFTISRQKAEEWLLLSESELMESSYFSEDYDIMELRSHFANEYIWEIHRHISEFYLPEKRTVLSMMKELFRIARTGEISIYQSVDDLNQENIIFSHLRSDSGLSEVQYAGKLLKYYASIYEECDEETLREIQSYNEKLSELSELRILPLKSDLQNSSGVQQDTFIVDLKAHFDKYIFGQDSAKKKMAVLIYNWIFQNVRTNFLLIGPTGSGKNLLINTLRTFPSLGRSVICFDCSALTPNGFQGTDIKEIFRKVQEVCEQEGNPVEGTIVYLDEVDKIIYRNTDRYAENVNAFVQQQLLSILSGTEHVYNVDTNGILFVLGGAFGQLEEYQKEKRNIIGFSEEKPKQREFSTRLREQIIAIGGERELVGRIGEIAILKKLERSELHAILMDEHIGFFPMKRKSFAQMGIMLEMTPDMIPAILDRVESEEYGARSVGNIMNELADGECLFDMIQDGYTRMVLHPGMLLGEKPYYYHI